MTEKDQLDDYFAAARREAPRPTAELLARISADAAAEQATWSSDRPASYGGWGAVLRGLGGWPTFAGLATATVAGIYIGLAQPLGVDPFAVVGLGIDESALFSGYSDLGWDEG